MPKATKKLIAQREKLLAARDAAIQVVFEAAPRNDIPFQTCLTMASDSIRNAYLETRAALNSFEDDMLSQCRAHTQNTFATFTWY